MPMHCLVFLVLTSVVMSVVCLPAYAPQNIRDHQLAESLVGPLLSVTGDPKWCKLIQLWDQLFVKDGILWRFFENLDGLDGVNQLVVPDSLKNEVPYGVHDSIGGVILEWKRQLLN